MSRCQQLGQFQFRCVFTLGCPSNKQHRGQRFMENAPVAFMRVQYDSMGGMHQAGKPHVLALLKTQLAPD